VAAESASFFRSDSIYQLVRAPAGIVVGDCLHHIVEAQLARRSWSTWPRSRCQERSEVEVGLECLGQSDTKKLSDIKAMSIATMLPPAGGISAEVKR
jgi:hypothetical protein